ncbi:hypothetical protein ACRALDRAFT_211293 [Sodiomyces alcalophilus JCM 7366]|uniref:uncharacterized protein n=1 Tax=Sodiomyces alcalophilus JCM 7366 TaxID=591952 RepID=UPI0039B5FBED
MPHLYQLSSGRLSGKSTDPTDSQATRHYIVCNGHDTNVEQMYLPTIPYGRGVRHMSRSHGKQPDEGKRGPLMNPSLKTSLSQMFHRKVVLHPDNTVVKSGKRYAAGTFPELYHDELIDYIAMSKWQNS